MQPTLSPTDFLAAARTGLPVLDVRSPGEYAYAHIPGATSFPLFTDAERAEVGTRYKQVGPEAAFLWGLEITGPKMADFVRQARKIAPGGKVLVHCWRGGQRSGSMAWLLRSAGMQVSVLTGGYKAYRNQVLADFAQPFSLTVLGGKTGSGKTAILHALRNMGAQILDLEGIAHHKGSAFGAVMEAPQPSSEQFENLLHHALMALDPARPIWVEDESRSIGSCWLPLPFWQQMQAAPVMAIDLPLAERVNLLVQVYASAPRAELSNALSNIRKRLGGQHEQAAQEALAAGDYAQVVRITLGYYDKTYLYGLSRRTEGQVTVRAFDVLDPEAIAASLLG